MFLIKEEDNIWTTFYYDLFDIKKNYLNKFFLRRIQQEKIEGEKIWNAT